MVVLITVISILVGLSACASKEEITDELIDYYNKDWIPIHVMKLRNTADGERRFREFLLELDGKDVQEMEQNELDQINRIFEEDIIPTMDRVVNRYKSVQVEHRKIKKLNEMQIEAEEFARTLMKNGINYFKGEITESEYREDVNELKRKYDEVNDYLENLMDKYNVEYDYEKDSINGYYEIKRAED